MAGEWLTTDTVKSTIGSDLATDVDDAALEVHVTAVRDYVEDRRADLWQASNDDEDVLVFTAPPRVVTGAARLAFACYQSTSDPDATVTDDVRALLGIGKHRRFRVGGAAALVVVP